MKNRIYLLALLFVSCADNSRSIKVKGSDTEVNLAVTLAENFYRIDDDYSLSVSGGGSGLGIASLLNGQTDIANSSRSLYEEKKLFKGREIELQTKGVYDLVCQRCRFLFSDDKARSGKKEITALHKTVMRNYDSKAGYRIAGHSDPGNRLSKF